jgi:hypothetical protein
MAISAVAAHAQITLTAATSTPVAGTSDTLHQNTTFLAGNAGANQTWDFSTQSFSSVNPNVFEACNSSNNCSTFPGTNLVFSTTGGYMYYSASATALSNLGVAAGGLNIPYTNPEDIYRFPFTYGNSYTDTWAATVVNSGVTFYRSGIDSVSADGWGTLITPAGTFTNTLRLKRIMTYQDSTIVGTSSVIITYKETLYTWNDLAHKDILYSTSSLVSTIQGSPSTSNSSTYVSGQSASAPTGVASVSAAALGLQISPNPAHDRVKVALSLKAASNVAVSIMDVTGRAVYTSQNDKLPAGNNEISIATQGFHAGLYLVRVMTENAISTSKLVIQ